MLPLVKVKVTEPPPIPVTTPALVTVATAGLLLTQVPPVVGDKVVVEPTQILSSPVMLTLGKALMLTAGVGAETQPVLVLVNVNVAEPAAMPSTTPPLVTVATAGLLLAQVPPVVGDKVVVLPTQTLLEPVMLTIGAALIVTNPVAAEIHPVTASVNVNVAVPADTPVTTPALVTIATAGLLLTQVPPVVGDKVVVLPTQMLLAPVILTVGAAFTVMAEVGADTQPVVVLVKVKVAEPAETPVTTPALVTVATAGLLLTQVPPVVGDKALVAPMQMLLEPVILTTGIALMVTVPVGADTQPVAVWVKVKVAVPAETPVTTPAFETVATPGLLLTQVPPVVGDKVVVAATQMLLAPVMLTVGSALTVTGKVGTDTQPVMELVKVKVTEPADKPVTFPLFVTVATAGLLLTQVPPVVGDKVVFALTQIVLEPVMLTAGIAFTVTGSVGTDAQPLVLVKVKVAVPAVTPVTTPAFVTVATAGLLLAQVPPVVGDNVVVAPAQIVLDPVILTTGVLFTVIAGVGAETQPVVVFVKVNVAVPFATAVTTPSFVTVATAGLLLAHVPPVEGDNPVVSPIQRLVAPMMLTIGIGSTVTEPVGSETQPVVLLV